MKPSLFRLLAIIVCLTWQQADAQTTLAKPSPGVMPEILDAPILFTGYVMTGDSPLVALMSLGDKAKGTRWVGMGEVIDGYRVMSLNQKSQMLTLRAPDGDEVSIPLSVAKTRSENSIGPLIRLPKSKFAGKAVKERPPIITYEVYPPKDTVRSVEGLDWNWINSDENMMRELPIIPRAEEADSFPKMTKAQKDEFIELYRQCGWEITVSTNSAGVGIRYRKIEQPAGMQSSEKK